MNKRIKELILLTTIALLPQFLCSSTAEGSRSGSSLEEETQTVYVVKWYETLDDVAKKFGVSKEILIEYNSLDGEKLKRHQEIKIPHGTGFTAKEEEKTVNILDTLNKKVEEVMDKVQESLEKIRNPKVSLVLPLNAGSEDVNESAYEFYSGVLMALRDLSLEGKNVRLNVVDCSGNYSPMDFFLGEDLVIGPLSKSNLESTLSRCTESTKVVSPLDPRTAGLCENHPNFYLAPSPMEYQYSALCDWISDERQGTDEILVLSEKGSGTTPLRDSLLSRGLEFKEYDYDILDGREAFDYMDSLVITPDVTTRIVISSDNEAFVCDAVRNCALLTFKGHNVVLYSSSKIRNYENIEPEDLHKLNAHISCAHYIDYDGDSIKRFLLDYRALFCEEPTPYSFQGYDTANCFIRELLNGEGFSSKYRGLQSDFLFTNKGEGRVNSAIRKIVYGENYTVKLVE